MSTTGWCSEHKNKYTGDALACSIAVEYRNCSCETCSKYREKKRKRYREEALELGVCIVCRKHPPPDDGVTCQPCRDRDAQKRQELREANTCVNCMGNLVLREGTLCEHCCKQQRARHLERKLEEFNVDREWYEERKGACELCEKTEEESGRRLAVDHDHDTGQARGVLCSACNMMISFVENEDWLQRVEEYLDRQ